LKRKTDEKGGWRETPAPERISTWRRVCEILKKNTGRGTSVKKEKGLNEKLSAAKARRKGV